MFWLTCLAAHTTEEFENRTISWLRNNINLFWLDTLDDVVLGFITWVAVSPIAICRKSIDKKVMQTIFCLVFTFNYVANKLFPNLKDTMRIKRKTLFDSL